MTERLAVNLLAGLLQTCGVTALQGAFRPNACGSILQPAALHGCTPQVSAA